MIKIYLPKGSVNDATEYYISLIEKALSKNSLEHMRVSTVSRIRHGDTVLTVTPLNAYILTLVRRRLKIINWFQGVAPEEYKLLHTNSPVRAKLFDLLLSFVDKSILKSMKLGIFVSNSMIKHYTLKYGVDISNKSMAMPCYNSRIERGAFMTEDRYSYLSFVYAGGLYAWQRVEDVASIFSHIESKVLNAKLTIMTRDLKEADKIIAKYRLRNARAEYVSADKLDDELKKYKYGFLVREDITVNRVATPTKMSTYLANGVIPIYTDVIDDFMENIDLKNHCVILSGGEDTSKIAEIIMEHHKINISCFELYENYKTVFERYYSDDYNVTMLSRFFDRL